jgi:hypothetical protein
MSRSSPAAVQQIWLEPLHVGQMRAYRALAGHRFMALRCGRRFGKTALAKSWAAQGLLQGEEVGWFAPEHKHMAEVYAGLKVTLASLLVASAKTPPALQLSTGQLSKSAFSHIAAEHVFARHSPKPTSIATWDRRPADVRAPRPFVRPLNLRLALVRNHWLSARKEALVSLFRVAL